MDEVTAAQAAALTGLSERTIRRKIAAGQIRARHIAANRYAIKVADLPMRPPPTGLVARIADLESRVRVLEAQQAQRLAEWSALRCAPETSSSMPEAASVAGVREALLRLVRETELLAPLLTALPGGAELHEQPSADCADTRLGAKAQEG
jgi:hypothetical protein